MFAMTRTVLGLGIKDFTALIRVLKIAGRLLLWCIPCAIRRSIQASVEPRECLDPIWNEHLVGGNIKVSTTFLINDINIIETKRPEMVRLLPSLNSFRKEDEISSFCGETAQMAIAIERLARLCLDSFRSLDGSFVLLFQAAFTSLLSQISPLM